MEATVAEQKTYFPQVPLEEVRQLMAKRAACRRPANVIVQQHKGSDPYSVPVSAETRNVTRTLGTKK